jgi:transcriptional regulator with XRE-family HTH domain
LRRLREAAGLSVRQVGEAIDLKDPALLDLVENGRAALPFEIVLRLASVLGRNDPVSFVMRFTRSWQPRSLAYARGPRHGRLALHAGRERELSMSIAEAMLRERSPTRTSAAVLAFVKQAFEIGSRVPERKYAAAGRCEEKPVRRPDRPDQQARNRWIRCG